MSYSVDKTRKQLPLRYATLFVSLGLLWFVPHHELLTDLSLWYLLPGWVLLGHLLCGFSYFITGFSTKRALALFRGSFVIYGKGGSLVHLQAAFLVALIEEAIFRYSLLPFLGDTFGSAIGALLVVSFAFSFMHFSRGFSLARVFIHVDHFVFALILGGLVIGLQSFYPALILHTMRNYILRCILISKDEYRQLQKEAEEISSHTPK